MNRNNFWIHFCIAVILIAFAAVLGQLRLWQSKPLFSRNTAVKSTPKPIAPKRSVDERQPEVLVKFRSDVSLAEIRRIAEKNNDRIEDQIEEVKGLIAIDDLDNGNAETVAEQYAQMSNLVKYAEPNYEIKLDDPTVFSVSDALLRESESNPVTPNDPKFSEQWALNNSGQNGGKANADVAALKAWIKTQGSTDVVVAVLDTGVDYKHTDLAANMWFRPDNVPQYRDQELGTFNDLQGFNAADNLSDPMDDNGHGTHCSGIIGAEGDNDEGIAGINWKVKIMPLKFMGRGGFGTTKDAIEAINYAIDRKRNGVNVRIINASWGSTVYSKALEDVIRAAGEEGILFVAAAGNNGSSNDRSPHYPSNYNLPNVISVAALDRNDNLASFSNFGVKTVHIAAPGREILSTWLGDEYREASGTSMATPYVAGLAGLVLASEPKLSVEKLRERVLKSVDKLDSLNGKVETGGRINAGKALGN
ncbi:MAG: Serine protease, subtilase family [uncultured Pyrinomonadaceae bacterium]|uniref:Serine protease, subtilase family n=1 Tax=uncultured Pyrinomonadaceae bacterium TaxID=2283094 RepID=A0A6J4N1U7_9BACT|nr:MAG: Serine protease, subtilase family [uncultured Pyrinomonadaceae bacterium]